MALSAGAFTILVRDYDEAIAFFTNAIGLELVEDTDRGAGRRWVVVGGRAGATVVLAKADTPEQIARIGDQTGGRVGFFLHSDDIDADHRRMVEHGVRFREALRHEPYGSVAVFEDLAGNAWDLIQPAQH